MAKYRVEIDLKSVVIEVDADSEQLAEGEALSKFLGRPRCSTCPSGGAR
jgi:hypothetical protein